MDENFPNPWGHSMSFRSSEVNVEHQNCHTNTRRNSCKCERKMTMYLKVSNIIVKSTNFPNRGTTSEVGGIISASRRKNTVNDNRMFIERLTCKIFHFNLKSILSAVLLPFLHYQMVNRKLELWEKIFPCKEW